MAIKAQTKEDADRIAHQLVRADEVVSQITGSSLCGRVSDLALLQQVLSSKLIETEASYTLQALGMAFGKVFVENNEHYDWCMVEDENGRDPAIRCKETALLIFPEMMLSKRIEAVDVQLIYKRIQEQMDIVRAPGYFGV